MQLVEGTSNFLVANMYWMVAFKVHVFDVSLFEETRNRSNSEIWKPILSSVFSSIWKVVQDYPPFIQIIASFMSNSHISQNKLKLYLSVIKL